MLKISLQVAVGGGSRGLVQSYVATLLAENLHRSSLQAAGRVKFRSF